MPPSPPTQAKRVTDQSGLLITVLLLFDSFHYVFGRELHLYISPNVSAMYVMIISTAEIALYGFVTRQLDWRVLRRHLWFFLAIGALIGFATNLGYTALGSVDPGTASMLGKIGTIFAIGFGMIWLRERFTGWQWLGALIAIGGSFIIAYRPGNYLQFGSLLLLLEALLYSLHTTLVKRYGGEIDFINFFFFRLLATATILFMLAVGTRALAWPSAIAWRWLIVTATVDVVISRIFYYVALRRLNMSVHTLILTLSPAITVIWSFWLFRTLPTLQQLSGGAAILFGVLIVLSQQRTMKPSVVYPPKLTKGVTQ
ncbi:MAG: DMT family transporter [Chloroflexi bacterium]|nr:DMT family transporter [Chloroflexota bacterium]